MMRTHGLSSHEEPPFELYERIAVAVAFPRMKGPSFGETAREDPKLAEHGPRKKASPDPWGARLPARCCLHKEE